jgi:hypothetical protein
MAWDAHVSPSVIPVDPWAVGKSLDDPDGNPPNRRVESPVTPPRLDFEVTVTDHHNPPLSTFCGRLVLREVLTERPPSRVPIHALGAGGIPSISNSPDLRNRSALGSFDSAKPDRAMRPAVLIFEHPPVS